MRKPVPCEFRRVVELDAPIAEVYAFHADPRNAAKISPAWQSIHVVVGAAEAEAGQSFEMEVRVFGLPPIRWRGVWHRANPPDLLIDDASQSPFAYWRHRHVFEPLGAHRTRMIDHVSYLFPGGWLGKWFGETVGRVQFHWMFADRQARTRRWMREQHGTAL